MGKTHRVVGAAVMAIAAVASNIASGQLLTDQWQFGAAIYGWLPSIGGKTTFPAGTGSGVDVDGSKIIGNLKFAFLGGFQAQKNQWGFFTDIVYLDIGSSKSNTRDLTIGGGSLPAGVTANASLDLKGEIWTLAASDRIVAARGTAMDVFVGARLLEVKENFTWEFSADIGGLTPPPRRGGSDVKLSNVDGIVGAKGRYGFGGDGGWFVPYYVDVGAGGSQFTWQAYTGIGYAFKGGEVFAVYRYLDYKFNDKAVESLNFGGPAIGVAFRW